MKESNHYSSATAAAVTRWQTALGVPATGAVLLGQVTFEPGPIRVTSVTAAVGQTVTGNGSTVLDATSTTPIVTVSLEVTQEYLLKPGDAVTVLLPDGSSTVGGHVEIRRKRCDVSERQRQRERQRQPRTAAARLTSLRACRAAIRPRRR